MSDVAVLLGEIAQLAVDAIVRDANVDTTVLRSGGAAVCEALHAIGRCPTGSASITTAGFLPARYLIHAVAPRYTGGQREIRLLRRAYTTALELARQRNLRSVALQVLGHVPGSNPGARYADIAVDAVREHTAGRTSVERIIFVLSDHSELAAFGVASARIRKPGR